MKEKECNFAMLNQQRMVTLTRNTNGLKNGTHYNLTFCTKLNRNFPVIPEKSPENLQKIGIKFQKYRKNFPPFRFDTSCQQLQSKTTR